jgi:hypothetical protein
LGLVWICSKRMKMMMKDEERKIQFYKRLRM